MKIEEIKKQYNELQKKYQLPSFESVNVDFEIEKIENETEYFARTVRKTMMDKVVNALGFFDMFTSGNPVPRLYMPFVKSMNGEDKKILDELYNVFASLSLKAMTIELNYIENKEIVLIKEIFKVWNLNKPKFEEFLNKVASPTPAFEKKEKSYFG